MHNRREFIKQALQAAAITAAGNGILSKIQPGKYVVENPYALVNWNSWQQIASATHVHVENQEKLDRYCKEFKLRHLPISNYYPSAPAYPADKIMKDQFKVKQDFEVRYNADTTQNGRDKWKNASVVKGPIAWNDIIKEWGSTLPEDKKKQLPFSTGGRLYPNIPDNVIISPNAEHHSFSNSSLHSCAIGSLYSSGTFDAHDEFGTFGHGYCYGTGLPWQEVFKRMIDALLFPDAGGISINHPVWSSLSFEEVCQMLDFDNRVLGMEIFNDTCATGYGDPGKGWAITLWDKVLSTKRKCMGFCVPDHTLGRGRNILLVPEFTEHACLKAYRQGAFFGAINGTGLAFSRIDLQENKLIVQLNKPGRIRIVSDLESDIKNYSATAEHPLQKDAAGIPKMNYIRIEAWDDSSEQLYSQPIYFHKS